jgi:hypothetical protein
MSHAVGRGRPSTISLLSYCHPSIYCGKRRNKPERATPPIYLPFHRSNRIDALEAHERVREFERAERVKLCVDSMQQQYIPEAMNGSLFMPDELLIMVTRFPKRADWAAVSLWQLMQLAIKAEAEKPLCDAANAIQGPPPKQVGRPRKYDTKLMVDAAFVRDVIRQSGKSVLVIAHETGVHRIVVRAFLEGKEDMPDGVVKRLAKHFHVQPVKLPTAA